VGVTESPGGAGLSWEAAEGIRTLDLLHGKRILHVAAFLRKSAFAGLSPRSLSLAESPMRDDKR
jgi:hypothetical protein